MSFPYNKEILGCILGPAKGEGNKMAQWVMKGSGNVVPHKTLSHTLFDSLSERKWSTSMNPPPETTPDDQDLYEEYEDDDKIARFLPEMEETI
eukprot:6206327-Ditylum_brightwellii.AAC.1